MRPHSTPMSSLGSQLVWWRRQRGLSQLEAALRAQVSSRHLSFLENDRARPSREVLMRLAGVLDIPLRAQNALLVAAGLAPRYRESRLEHSELARAVTALATIVDNHNPYPAIVLDHLWNIVRANQAMVLLTNQLLTTEEQAAAGAPNIMRLTYHPQGLRRYITNWDETAFAYIQWLHRDIRNFAEPMLESLMAEVLSYAPPDGHEADLNHSNEPYLTINFAKDELTANFFTVGASLGTPYDITLQALRLELFYPADDHTAALMQNLGRAHWPDAATTVPGH